jgi:hypothetical protein
MPVGGFGLDDKTGIDAGRTKVLDIEKKTPSVGLLRLDSKTRIDAGRRFRS